MRLLWLINFFVLLSSPLLHAESLSCPHGVGVPAAHSWEELKQREQAVAAYAVRCERDAHYLAWHGALLNALNRPHDAADRLERALLLNPELMVAKIDYAEALTSLGETRAARQLLQEVLTRPDLPSHLQPVLQARYQALGNIWLSRAYLTSRLGYDSNLTSAPRIDRLTLTLPDGNLPLLLAESYRRQSGVTASLEFNGDLSHPLDSGGTILFYGDMRLRHSPSVRGVDYAQIDTVAAYLHPNTIGDALLSVGSSFLHYNGETLYRSARVSLAQDWQWADCRPRVGWDSEWRQYPQTPELDGRFAALSIGLSCHHQARTSFILRAGRDEAARRRAGGGQWRIEARAAASWPLAGGVLDTDLNYSLQRDDRSYSPLLANGLARRVQRWTARAEYRYPLSRDWQALSSIEVSRQNANLELFDVNSHAFSIGIRRTW